MAAQFIEEGSVSVAWERMKYELYKLDQVEGNRWVGVLYSQELELTDYPKALGKAVCHLELISPVLKKQSEGLVYWLVVGKDQTKYRIWSESVSEITENEFRAYLRRLSLQQEQAQAEMVRAKFNYDRFESREDDL